MFRDQIFKHFLVQDCSKMSSTDSRCPYWTQVWGVNTLGVTFISCPPSSFVYMYPSFHVYTCTYRTQITLWLSCPALNDILSFLLFPQALLLLQFVAQSVTGCMFTVVSSSLYKTRQKYVRLNTVEFLLKWRFDSNPAAQKLCCTYCLIKHLQSRFLERFETYIVHIHHCLLAVLICPVFVGVLLLQCLAPNCTNCRSVAIVLKLLAR